MGYREDVSIDVHNMQEECAGHPAVHFDYGVLHADALRERRMAELEEQEVQAAVDDEVRSDLTNRGVKFTETALRRSVENDDRYKAARRKALDAAHKVNVLAAALEALNDKTRMLTNITNMQLAHWQAEPNGQPLTGREARQQAQAQVTEGQHAALADVPPRRKAGGKSAPKPVG